MSSVQKFLEPNNVDHLDSNHGHECRTGEYNRQRCHLRDKHPGAGLKNPMSIPEKARRNHI